VGSLRKAGLGEIIYSFAGLTLAYNYGQKNKLPLDPVWEA